MTPRELMTDYLAAAKRGDWDTAFGFLAEDVLVHIPGRSAFAGRRRGKDAAVHYIQTIRDRYPDGAIELELIDMLASDERVVLLVRERFHGDGPPVEIRRANVYRVRDGEVVKVSIFEGDQYVVDEQAADVRAAAGVGTDDEREQGRRDRGPAPPVPVSPPPPPQVFAEVMSFCGVYGVSPVKLTLCLTASAQPSADFVTTSTVPEAAAPTPPFGSRAAVGHSTSLGSWSGTPTWQAPALVVALSTGCVSTKTVKNAGIPSSVLQLSVACMASEPVFHVPPARALDGRASAPAASAATTSAIGAARARAAESCHASQTGGNRSIV